MRFNRGIVALAAILIVILCTSATALALDGQTLAEQNCVRCHLASRWQGIKKSRDEWSKVVDQMIRNGASNWISNTQEEKIIDYLANQEKGENSDIPVATVTTQPVAETTATATTPKQQASTGAEVWLYVLSGGGMVMTGLKMRRKP